MIQLALEEVNESIGTKQLNSHKDDSKTPFIEINLRLSEWLIVGAYKPPEQTKSVFSESLSKTLSIYLNICENVILLGYLNMTTENRNLQTRTSGKESNLFQKIPILRRFYHHTEESIFQKACMLETGLSDFQELT